MESSQKKRKAPSTASIMDHCTAHEEEHGYQHEEAAEMHIFTALGEADPRTRSADEASRARVFAFTCRYESLFPTRTCMAPHIAAINREARRTRNDGLSAVISTHLPVGAEADFFRALIQNLCASNEGPRLWLEAFGLEMPPLADVRARLAAAPERALEELAALVPPPEPLPATFVASMTAESTDATRLREILARINDIDDVDSLRTVSNALSARANTLKARDSRAVMAQLDVGDAVCFSGRRGETMRGTILKLNRTTASVKNADPPGGVWRVSVTLLRPAAPNAAGGGGGGGGSF